ncbi:MAG: MFS transporter [Sphingomonadaceae bacterium]|nr:MFS transporter [Sphingomonadaceae bacterium]MDW8415402.1 MFS transporter [Thermaurantiacus sp.]
MGRAPPLPWATRLAYGLGAVATGVKNQGFAYFLLLFYGQVVGLDARLVGLALFIALVADAVSDPVVATWSDNLRSRWGRRHPFLYAAALPVAVAFYFVWNPPPGASQGVLFAWLVTFAVLVRLLMTLHEVPSIALAPELVADYDGRSALLSLRTFLGWSGGNLMTVLMFALIFPVFSTAATPDGQFNREAYTLYAAIGSGTIATAILVSALGTHGRIPHLFQPLPRGRLTPKRLVAEMVETLASRSFAALFGAALLGAVASGLASALAFYLYTYFWRFSAGQVALLTSGVFVSAAIGGLLAPLVTRRLGKKRGAILMGLAAFLGSPLPILLRLAGLLPEAPWAYWAVLAATIVDVGLIIGFQILMASMMADLVEQAEVRTGRRSEGLFFGAVGFAGKLVTGLGVTAASLLVAAAGLRTGASPAEVPRAVSDRLAALYVPTILALWMGMIAVLSLYRLRREDHERNLRILAARRGA